MTDRYPHVLSELETLRLVVSGRSISRYGDGEFKMCEGADIKSQRHHPGLQRRLRDILTDSGQCLVGIPNIHSDTPKAEHWKKYARFAYLLSEKQTYGSAFITRPDSAPWIHDPSYWALLESLWKGRAVTLVRGSTKSFTAERLIEAGAGSVTEIVAMRQHAFEEYDALLERIGRPERALLCLGPTATVLAVDLCKRGVHAIDLGHAGMFHKKLKTGEEMVVTDADKVPV